MYSEHFKFNTTPFRKITDKNGELFIPYHQDVFSLITEKSTEAGIFCLYSDESMLLEQFSDKLNQSHSSALQINAFPKLSGDTLLYKLNAETAKTKQKISAVDLVIRQWKKETGNKLLQISDISALRDSGWKVLVMLLARARELGLTLSVMLTGDCANRARDLTVDGIEAYIHTRLTLRALSAQESTHYIHDQTQTNEGESPVFPRARIRKICRLTKGNITRIHQLSHLALLAAWAERAPRVKERHLRMAAGEALPPRRGKGLATAMLLTVVAAVAVGWILPASLTARLPVPLPVPASWSHLAQPQTHAAAPSIENEVVDMPNAMHQLYKVWGYDASADDALCQNASRVDLQCHQGKETLETLEKDNTPWIAELKNDHNISYAVVAHTGSHSLDLLINNHTWQVSRHWFEQHATGHYTRLQRLTPDGKESITASSSAKDIQWFDAALSQALSLPTTHASGWTAELMKRTRDFQQQSGINVDGLAGEETLTHLLHTTNMTPVVRTPGNNTSSVEGKA